MVDEKQGQVSSLVQSKKKMAEFTVCENYSLRVHMW